MRRKFSLKSRKISGLSSLKLMYFKSCLTLRNFGFANIDKFGSRDKAHPIAVLPYEQNNFFSDATLNGHDKTNNTYT
jgi:hypothetical protein